MNNKTITEFGFRIIWRIMDISEAVIRLGLWPRRITPSSISIILHKISHSLIVKYIIHNYDVILQIIPRRVLKQLKRKCNCLFHQARVCKYIPLTQTPISYLGLFYKWEMLSLEESKPVSIALELIIGEPAHRVHCRFILRGGGGGGYSL